MHRRTAVLAVALLHACPPPERMSASRDGSAAPRAEADAGWQLTAAALDRWLELRLGALDGGGRGAQALAREDARRRAAVGLSPAEVEHIDAVVADVMVERSIAALSTSRRAQDLERALSHMTPEQRVRLAVALGPVVDGGAPEGWDELGARHGQKAIRVVLEREAEVHRAWEAMLAAD